MTNPTNPTETVQQSSNLFGEEVFNPTKKLGQVILGWKDGNSKGFANILNYYCPPPAVVVDLMAGHKNFYKGIHTDLYGKSYKFIFGDIRYNKSNTIQADIKHAPIKTGIADAVIFDPPWPSESGTLADMLVKYHPMNENDFDDFMRLARPEAERILKENGYFIFKGKSPYTHRFYHETSLTWVRDIPSISVMRGVYLPVYFMVFKKEGF
jgi:hypothetical protein